MTLMLALLTIFLLMQGLSNSKFAAMLGFLRAYSQYGSNAGKDLSLLIKPPLIICAISTLTVEMMNLQPC